MTNLRFIFEKLRCACSASEIQTILYIDRLQTLSQPPSHLTLAACILIATKQYEIYPPTVSILLSEFKHEFTKSELENREIEIVFELEWRLVDVLPFHFTEVWFEWIQGGVAHFDSCLDLSLSTISRPIVERCVLFMSKCKLFSSKIQSHLNSI